MQTEATFWAELAGKATTDEISRTRDWLKYWSGMEAETGADVLESLPDEQFDALVMESRKQCGISADVAFPALLATTGAKVGFGRIEDAPKPDLVN